MKPKIKTFQIHVLRILASFCFGVFAAYAFTALGVELFDKGPPGPNDGLLMFLFVFTLPAGMLCIPCAWFAFGNKWTRIPFGVGAFLGFALIVSVAYGFLNAY